MSLPLLLCFFFFSVSVLAISGPQGFFSSADAAHTIKLVTSKQVNEHFGSFKDTHLAIRTLTSLGVDFEKKNDLCRSYSAKYENGDAQLEDLFHIVSTLKALDCFKGAPARVQSVVKTKSDDLFTLLYSTDLLSNLNQLSKNQSEEILSSLLSLLDPQETGLFKSGSEAQPSVLYAGKAFYIFSRLIPFLKNNPQLQTVHDQIENLLSNHLEENGNEAFFQDKDFSNLKATAAVVGGLSAIAPHFKIESLSHERIIQFANYFIRQKSARSFEDAVLIVWGISSLSASSIPSPLVLRAINSNIKQSEPFFKVEVSDLLGRNVEHVKVFVNNAYLDSDVQQRALISNQEIHRLQEGDKTFGFNFLVTKPESGLYSFDFGVHTTLKDRYIPIDSVTLKAKVSSSASVYDFEVAIVESSDDSASKRFTIDYPNKHQETLTVEYYQKIRITFQVRNQAQRSLSVQQSFVRIFNNQNDELVLVARNTGKQYELTLGLEQASKLLGDSGNYEAELIIGDAFITQPLQWKFASLSLRFPNERSAREQRPDPFAKAPEIHHLFRQPEKRAPAQVSLAFTALVLSPWLVLAFGVLKLGPKLSHFPSSPLPFLSGVVFHVLLAAILALFVWYWIQLTMITTLLILSVLLIPTILSGSVLLGHLHQVKQPKTKTQ